MAGSHERLLGWPSTSSHQTLALTSLVRTLLFLLRVLVTLLDLRTPFKLIFWPLLPILDIYNYLHLQVHLSLYLYPYHYHLLPLPLLLLLPLTPSPSFLPFLSPLPFSSSYLSSLFPLPSSPPFFSTFRY